MNLNIYNLTLLFRDLEKLIVLYLVKKSPAFM
jgi:hypothetical protein